MVGRCSIARSTPFAPCRASSWSWPRRGPPRASMMASPSCMTCTRSRDHWPAWGRALRPGLVRRASRRRRWRYAGLVPAVLERLVAALEGHDAAVLADEAGPRPLPMAIRPSVAGPAVERLIASGERRLRALIGELDAEVIPPSIWRRDDPTGATLTDVDTPADLPDQKQKTRRPPSEGRGSSR